MDKAIYRQLGLPLFQNKVYSTFEAAKRAITGDVELTQCEETGLVHNNRFDSTLIEYDENYQNEQACSPAFQQHLEQVLEILLSKINLKDMGVEVGCGKGFFLEMLLKRGANIVGYDPTYEGSSPHVIKTYFGKDYSGKAPDYVVLRHVLEHIASPWLFLERLSAYCSPTTKIYIEVPCFDWIVKNNAFYDIFYEHVNYFTLDVLRGAFGDVLESGNIFGGQYLYIVANLATFKKASKYTGIRFQELTIDHYLDQLLLARSGRSNQLFLWGAGAKGMTFSSILLRKDVSISAIIDINPVKQNKFAGLSGVPIIAPYDLSLRLKHADVFVMNPVYLDEIRKMANESSINWISVA